MKKLLAVLAFLLVGSSAWAQCTGVFPNNTYCGNITGSPAPPGPSTVAPGALNVGTSLIGNGTNNRLLYDNSGVLGEAIVGSGLTLSSGTLSSSATGTVVTSQIPQLPIAPSNIAGSPLPMASCLVSGGSSPAQWQTCPNYNLLRNSSLVGSHCTAGGGNWGPGTQCTTTITTSGGWCGDGIWVIPVGASITCKWQSAGSPSNGLSGLVLTGGVGVTDIKLRFVQESVTSQWMRFHMVTFQLQLQNVNNASFTPTIQGDYPNNNAAADDWSVVGHDLTAQPMQECVGNTSQSFCTETYTWQPQSTFSGGVNQGYEETIDLHLTDTAANGIIIIPGFSLSVTDGLPAGINPNPPTPIFLPPQLDHLWNQRFFQMWGDIGSTPNEVIGTAHNTSTTASFGLLMFWTMMRAVPTMAITAQNAVAVCPETGAVNSTAVSFGNTSQMSTILSITVASGLVGGQPCFFQIGNSNGGNVFITAEAGISGG